MKRRTNEIIGFTLALFFIFYPQFLLAQDKNEWERLNQKVVESYRQGRYEEGLNWALQAYIYAKKHLGEKHPDTLGSMNNLAFLYQAQGRYGEAEPLYKKAYQLRQEVLGEKHPDTLTSHLNYAVCLINLKQEKRALTLLKKMEKSMLKRADLLFYSLQKERVRRKFFFSTSTFQSAIFTLAQKHPTPDTFRLAADVILRWKQMQVEEEAFIANLVQQSQDPDIQSLAQRISDLRSRLARIANTPQTEEKKSDNGQLVIEELEVLEAKLAQKSRSYKERLEVANKDMEDVRLNLPPESVLIEFRTYWPMDFKKGELGKSHIAAVLLLSDSLDNELFFEDIGSVEEIGKIWNDMLESIRFEITKQSLESFELRGLPQDVIKKLANIENKIVLGKKKFIGMIQTIIGNEPTEKYQSIIFGYVRRNFSKEAKLHAKALYQKLFGAFDEKIKALKTVYIAPDGFLNLVAFDRLILSDGTYWLERQDIRRLLTGRDLLRSPRGNKSDRLIAFGGIDFNHYASEGKISQEKPKNQQQASVNLRTARELKELPSLTASREEIDEIALFYKTALKSPAETKTGIDANETALKGITTPPKILHLSTHGFYRSNQDWSTERPLVLSGLALAGANLGLKGNIAPDGNDGIVYSLEILGLNLEGTDLVSLSACKTGQGTVDYSEGVYGLVRALKIAGARSVLMTLWSVRDDEAKDFMVEFYTNWLSIPVSDSVTTLAQALRKTRLHYINHEKESLRDPMVWAPYVLVGK